MQHTAMFTVTRVWIKEKVLMWEVATWANSS